MTEEQALFRLGKMVASDVDPVLTSEELDELLEIAKREDTEGLAPSDDGWEPTFDLNSAAAEGWRWKAGRVAPKFGVTLDSDSLQRQQVYAHCVSQASIYAKKLVGTIGVMATDIQVEEESFQ